ncbi:MAG: hypothetical protein KGJ86_18155 [Chloroflexota bacterium]|nr:hypothetical protein [Chloroflexota bacterium]
MLRLGIDERGVTEIIGLADHVASLTAAAEGLRLPADVPTAAHPSPAQLVQPPSETPEAASASLSDIGAWARAALGIEHVPLFWKVLSHQPRFLAATWAKDRLVLGPGRLDVATKSCVALAVAIFRQSGYWTSYFNQLARRAAGLDDATLVELTSCVMHYVSFNTIAHGMRLEAPFNELTAQGALALAH